MKRPAYTLLEVLMALFLLSLICASLVPGLTSGVHMQTLAASDIETRLTTQTMVERLKANHLNGSNLPLSKSGYDIEIRQTVVKPGFIRYEIKTQKTDKETKAYELAIILPES